MREMDRQGKRKEGGEAREEEIGEGKEEDLYLGRGRDTHQGCLSELAGEIFVCVSVLGRGCVRQECVRRADALWEVAGRKQLERRRSSSRSSSCPAFCLSLKTRNRLS